MSFPTLDGPTISNIAKKEKEITGKPRPVKGGPTAQAQKHSGEPITGETVAAVADGEKKVTGGSGPRAGGPAAWVQGLLSGNTGQKASGVATVRDKNKPEPLCLNITSHHR